MEQNAGGRLALLRKKLGKKQIVMAENSKNSIFASNNPNWDKMTRFDIIEIQEAPILINDRTMLPFRFLAEALGAFVYYNAEDNIANVIGNNFEDAHSHTILSSQIAPYVLEEANKLREETYKRIAQGNVAVWKNSPPHYNVMTHPTRTLMGYGAMNSSGKDNSGPYQVLIFH